MNQSDDEDDFHSADEDDFEEKGKRYSIEKPLRPKQKDSDGAHHEEQLRNNAVIKEKFVEQPIQQESLKSDGSPDDPLISEETAALTTPNDSRINGSSTESKDSGDGQKDDDDDEETLVERIRERNIKIARKFSAEIARNLKASAPIPVKTSHSNSHEFSEISDPLDCGSSKQPRAPPSTPALSTSYNNLNDPTTQATGTSPSLNTQYSWRIPPKVASQQSSSGTSTPSKNNKPDEQARQVLDKLSERLMQTDKNIFERVAADIKKVSLKKEEVPTDLSSALTSITDLGSTLGGWGWSGATKILSSASQVTSQVSSVLDSVVGGPVESDSTSKSVANRLPEESTSSDNRTEQAPKDVTYNDPLVDLTLGAMESLGKKAFDVMTTRDETGSLQIKGLGRPWEHLLSSKKVNVPNDDVIEQQEPLRCSDSPPPVDEAPIFRSDSPPPPSTLKLRKRRND